MTARDNPWWRSRAAQKYVLSYVAVRLEGNTPPLTRSWAEKRLCDLLFTPVQIAEVFDSLVAAGVIETDEAGFLALTGPVEWVEHFLTGEVAA